MTDRLDRGHSGWLKRVSPPKAEDSPVGLPPAPTPGELHVHGALTEDDVRRTVRDELARAERSRDERKGAAMRRPPEVPEIATVQRWPVADIKPGDVVWCDEHGDWMKVKRIEQAFRGAPIYLYGPDEHDGIDHEYTNVVLRIVTA